MTLGIECFILVSFGVVSGYVMHLFSMGNGVDDVGIPVPHPTPPQVVQV